MKRVSVVLAVLIVIAGIGAVGISYFFGSLRVQKEAREYIAALESCTPFEQQAWAPILRGTVGRSVVGEADGSCVVTMDALGAGQIRCTLDGDGQAVMAQYIQDGADTVTFLGGQTASLRYSSANPDPMTVLLNGPSCTTEP